MERSELFSYMAEEYGCEPDFPFDKDFDSAVFRHKQNRKWFALLMSVPAFRMNLPGQETLQVLNLKCDPILRAGISQTKGICPAYHMNKTHWISVLIEKADDETIKTLVQMSFDLTKK